MENREINWDEVGKQRETATKADDPSLFCYGCAHSIGGAPFPSGPSGERPCFFCIRNKDREKWQEDIKKRHGKPLMQWYDGTPIAFYPMDVYTPIDMKEQVDRWRRKAEGDENWNEPKGGIRFG